MMRIAVQVPKVSPAAIDIARIATIVLITLGTTLLILAVRWASRRALASRVGSEEKFKTLVGFLTSVVVFVLYFVAIGMVLSELGISITTYLASASIIGLAVSFGSQGVVQDVITGLTVVLTDLLDVGDMVEVSGQTGIVEHVGIRFTVLVNATGARVFIPNRTIMNVVNYPRGFVRAFVDVRLPADPALASQAEELIRRAVTGADRQFGALVLVPATVEDRQATDAYDFIRVKFRIWPGQGAILDTAVKPSLAQALRTLDPTYADWMVAVHYRAEPRSDDPAKRLPRPAAVLRWEEERRAR